MAHLRERLKWIDFQPINYTNDVLEKEKENGITAPEKKEQQTNCDGNREKRFWKKRRGEKTTRIIDEEHMFVLWNNNTENERLHTIFVESSAHKHTFHISHNIRDPGNNSKLIDSFYGLHVSWMRFVCFSFRFGSIHSTNLFCN